MDILLVTNLISLTPGTLSLDVTDDRSTLYIHAMFADDPDEIRRQIKDGMERWVIEATE
jgi:multicomponent Na+:H+ antiporter subunit E